VPQNGAFPITGALHTRHRLLRTGSFIEAHSSSGTSMSEGPVAVVLSSVSLFSVSDIVCSSSGASSDSVDADRCRGIQKYRKKSSVVVDRMNMALSGAFDRNQQMDLLQFHGKMRKTLFSVVFTRPEGLKI
jgi:hypothetical protein